MTAVKRGTFVLALALVFALPLWAALPTTLVTLNLSNPDGTFPSAVPVAFAKVTATSNNDPAVVGTVWRGTYDPATGKVTWTLPQSSEVLIQVPIRGVDGIFQFGTAPSYTLNDLLPITPSTVPGWAASLSPLVSVPEKGGVIASTGAAWSSVAAGTNTYLLTADSAQTAGVKWAAPSWLPLAGGASAAMTGEFQLANFTTGSLPTPSGSGWLAYDFDTATMKLYTGAGWAEFPYLDTLASYSLALDGSNIMAGPLNMATAADGTRYWYFLPSGTNNSFFELSFKSQTSEALRFRVASGGTGYFNHASAGLAADWSLIWDASYLPFPLSGTEDGYIPVASAGAAAWSGAYVSGATDSTLTVSGAGPYTLGLNLGNANTWTVPQMVDGTTDAVQLTVQGNATQTGPILTVETSAGADVLTVDANGAINVGVSADTFISRGSASNIYFGATAGTSTATAWANIFRAGTNVTTPYILTAANNNSLIVQGRSFTAADNGVEVCGYSTFSASSGFSAALEVDPTISITGTATAAAVRISPYITSSGAGVNLLDVGYNSAANGAGTHTSKFTVSEAGAGVFASNVTTGGSFYTGNATNQGLLSGYVGSGTTSNALIYIGGNATRTNTSGDQPVVNIHQTYNQTSGTASNTSLRLTRTETALGSGEQYFIDAWADTTTPTSAGRKFSISNAGVTTATQYRLSALNSAPASASDTGTLGEVRITADYIYVCVATNTWVRTALSW